MQGTEKGDTDSYLHSNANMSVGSCRASLQLAISSMGNVNNNGGLSIGNVVSIAERVGGFSFI